MEVPKEKLIELRDSAIAARDQDQAVIDGLNELIDDTAPSLLPISWSSTFDETATLNRPRIDTITATSAQGVLLDVVKDSGHGVFVDGELNWNPVAAGDFSFQFSAHLNGELLGTKSYSVEVIDEGVLPGPGPSGSLLPEPANAIQTVANGEMSDPSVWQGSRLPDESTPYVVRHSLTQGIDTSFRGGYGIIRPDGALTCLSNSRLHSHGSLAVEGKLHKNDSRLRFYQNDDRLNIGNVGSGITRPPQEHPELDDYVSRDVGLWGMPHGEIKTSGTPMTGWVQCLPIADDWSIPPFGDPSGGYHFTRKIERTLDISAGKATVASEPVGWAIDDLILVALIEFSQEVVGADARYSLTKIDDINGANITLADPITAFSKRRDNAQVGTFLVNLTTRCWIDSALVTQEEDWHRAHILLFHHCHAHFNNTGFINLGPKGKNNLGRYGGAHFHHGEAGHGDGVEYCSTWSRWSPSQRWHVLHRVKGHKCNYNRCFNSRGHGILGGEDGLSEGIEIIGNFLSTCHRVPASEKLKLFRDTGGPQSEANALTETIGSHKIWAHAGPASNPNKIHSNVTHGFGQAMVVFDRPNQDGDPFVIRDHRSICEEGGPWGAMRNITENCTTFMSINGAKIDVSGFSPSEQSSNKSVQLYKNSHITAIHHCFNDYTSGLKAEVEDCNLSAWVPTVFNAGTGVSRAFRRGKVHFDHLMRPIFQFSFAVAYIDIPDLTIDDDPNGWTHDSTLVYRTPMVRIVNCQGTYKGRPLNPHEAYTSRRICEHMGLDSTPITDQWSRLNFEPQQMGFLKIGSATMQRFVQVAPSTFRRWGIYPPGSPVPPFDGRGQYYREGHGPSRQDGEPHRGAGNGILPGTYKVKLQGIDEEFDAVVEPGTITTI